MNGRSNALASYGKIANTESDPLQQLVMLYDGAMKFLRLAADDIEKKDVVAKANHVNRALDIINYLQGILDFERGGEVAQTLDRLYTIVSMKVLRASANLDAKALVGAANLLSPVRDSWHQVAGSDKTATPNQSSFESNAARLGVVA
jgi:flagellar protein FliS